ncbi:MAG TPA: 5-formyltetrahydrofolate cyclo-ligase [Verrucomicrobiae bacterium]|nr:5-formyltetrahydrofolate cyclo-ligase [Verrucomicrobiae bacterium]
MSSFKEQKSVIRATVRAELKKMSDAERSAASAQICSRLEEQELWRKAHSILFYAPVADEPDIWQLVVDSLAAGKDVLLPRFEAEHGHYSACLIRDAVKDVRIGRFGIREPSEKCVTIALNRLDLILVPGIAFDLDRRRLGRGKGFYDRLLAVLEGPTCGVAFDQQIVSQIPVEPHDMQLNCILTPTRWQCSNSPRAALK